MRRITLAITGASGALLGYRMLLALRAQACDVHLILSEGAKTTIACETDLTPADFEALADRVWDETDLAAPISSGSFVTDGMIIAPCSMKTLAAIAVGYDENLIVRAADVCLKEKRRLVLLPREMPFGRSHLRNMLTLSEDGAVILPPVLTFYNGADSVEKQLDHIIGKTLLHFGLAHGAFRPWGEDPS